MPVEPKGRNAPRAARKKAAEETPETAPQVAPAAAPAPEKKAEKPAGEPTLDFGQPFTMVWHNEQKHYFQNGKVFDYVSKKEIKV